MICKKCKKKIEDDSVYCRFCGKKQTSENKPRKKAKRAGGMGSVEQLSGNRVKPYRARMNIDGKRITIGTYATQTEALIALEEARINGISNIHTATLEDIYNIFVDKKNDKVSTSARTLYSSSFAYFDSIKNMSMRDIRTAHIQDAIDKAHKKGMSYSMIKKVQSLASMLCKLAMANDLIDKNYAQLVEIPIAAPKSERPSFSTEQLDLMWSLADTDKTAGIIIAMCYNGLRVNEFLDLKKEHVDLNKRLIFAPGSKTEAGKDRIVGIPLDLVPIYETMMKTEGEYLCPSPSGQRWDAKNFRNRAFYPFLEKHGMDADGKLSPNSCRHTYALLCVTHGLDPKATMDLLGHSKYSTTAEIYANATGKDLDFIIRESDKLKRRN